MLVNLAGGLELERIGKKLLVMVRDSFPTFVVGSARRNERLEQRNDDVDVLTDAVVGYLRKLSGTNLVTPKTARLYLYLSVTGYLENK